MGEFIIDFDELADYEAAALLLTVLAYPRPADAWLDQRYIEICALIIRRRAENIPGWAEDHQKIRPVHALVDLKRVEHASRDLIGILQKRRAAGEWALPFILESLGGQPTLPEGVRWLSQNMVAAYVAEKVDASSTENFKTRTLRPSHPVLPLCATLALAAGMVQEPEGPISLIDIVTADRTTIEAFVQHAEFLEQPILTSRKLKIKPETLIPIRVAN